MTASLARLEHSLSVGSLGSYIHWANQIPMLTLEEEQRYAHELRDHGHVESARKLILSHLRLVVKIARGYAGYGLQMADLIQEGNIGLMKAVKRFDPEVGVRLVSFSIHWIRAEIHEYVIRNWRIVKIATTKAQRKLFFKLRRQSKQRSWFSENEIKTISEELSVRPADIVQMEARLYHHDASINTSPSDDDDATYSDYYLEDHHSNPERLLVHDDWVSNQCSQLDKALLLLDERSRYILQQRWLTDKKQTLHQLATHFGVSAERIRQLEKNAMDKMKRAIQLDA